MLTKTQKIRLGVFLLIGFVLVGGGIAVLAGMNIFKRHDHYQIRFRETVSGLSEGSPVKVRGVVVGRVEKISISEEDVEVVNVEIRVRHKLPIYKKAVARLGSGGLTGLKHIEITGGDKDAGKLEPGSVIPSAPSQFTRITGKAEDIAFKVEHFLNNALAMTTPENRDRFVGLVDDTRVMMQEVGKTAKGVRDLSDALKPQLVNSLAEVRRAARELRHVAAGLDDLVGTTKKQVVATFAEGRGALRNIRKMTQQDGDLDKTLGSVRSVASAAEKKIKGPDIERSLVSLQSSMKAIQLLMVDVRALVNKASVDIRPVLRSARTAAEHLEEFARTVKENPSVLVRPSTARKRKLPR